MQLEDVKTTLGESDPEKGLLGAEFPEAMFDLCPECKRKVAARTLNQMYTLSR
jgi:hypothetical protein